MKVKKLLWANLKSLQGHVAVCFQDLGLRDGREKGGVCCEKGRGGHYVM